MKKINAIIIDDEDENIKLLSILLKNYCSASINIMATANNVKDGVTLINKLNPDLLFLDIMLGEGTGFDILEQIEERNDLKVIFVTSHDDFAIRAFKFNAIDYILKPIDVKEMMFAVNKVYEDFKKEYFLNNNEQIENLSKSIRDRIEPDFLAISSIDKVKFIKFNEILYCQSEGRYTTFHLTSGKKIVAAKNLGEFYKLLEDNLFFRIHNSYVVNLRNVVGIDKSAGNYCEIVNGKLLPIAKRRQDQLNRFLKIKF